MAMFGSSLLNWCSVEWNVTVGGDEGGFSSQNEFSEEKRGLGSPITCERRAFLICRTNYCGNNAMG